MTIFGVTMPEPVFWGIIIALVVVVIGFIAFQVYKGYKAELERQAKAEAKKKAAAKKAAASKKTTTKTTKR